MKAVGQVSSLGRRPRGQMPKEDAYRKQGNFGEDLGGLGINLGELAPTLMFWDVLGNHRKVWASP